MRIGIISDTHGLLRQEVLEQLRTCDTIIHAGDIDKESVTRTLLQIAPCFFVRGNADKEWAEGLPKLLEVEISGLRVIVVHNKKDFPEKLSKFDLAICGHSHKYEERMIGTTKMLNPGSCGPRRFHQPITMAILTMENDGWEIRKVEIPHDRKMIQKADTEITTDLIKSAMADIRKGRSAAEIAKRLNITEELAEEICRMDLTHPGVDADGIMTRLGL